MDCWVLRTDGSIGSGNFCGGLLIRLIGGPAFVDEIYPRGRNKQSPLKQAEERHPDQDVVGVRLKQNNSDIESAKILESSRPGRVLLGTDGGVLTSQSERLWLVGRGATAQTVTLEALTPSAGEIALTLAEGDVAIIPQTAAPAGRTRVWHVESTFGQPGLSAGRGMGVAGGAPGTQGAQAR